MSDLDFDELDKAVNTLMGDVPKVDPTKADNVKTLNINSTLPEESRPSLEKLNTELSRVNNAAPTSVDRTPASSVAPAPSLAARRGGRFMDVVHPSSDMKGVTKATTPMSRQGVTIEPVSTPGQADEKPADTSSRAETTIGAQFADSDDAVMNTAGEPSADSEPSKSDWPDPLDMTAYSAEPDTGNIATAVTANAPVVSLAVEDMDDDTDAQPLVSPFLADAKVEKRPLGGAPVEEVKAADEELGRAPALGVVAADDVAVERAAEQLPADPTVVDQPLPPELRSDLMAIETDGGTTASTVKSQQEDTTAVVEKVAAVEQSVPVAPAIDKKPLGESVAVSPSAPAPMPSGPTSIPQQYHEEPTTSDQTNGAIYDTDSYHQPLAHPAKTHSGWLWIIWILLLLMVGGGGAVALYFLGII